MVETRARAALAKFLEKEGMQRMELARRCGVSGATVYAWLEGHCRPDEIHRELIQTVSGVDKTLWENEADRQRRADARARMASAKRARAAAG